MTNSVQPRKTSCFQEDNFYFSSLHTYFEWLPRLKGNKILKAKYPFYYNFFFYITFKPRSSNHLSLITGKGSCTFQQAKSFRKCNCPITIFLFSWVYWKIDRKKGGKLALQQGCKTSIRLVVYSWCSSSEQVQGRSKCSMLMFSLLIPRTPSQCLTKPCKMC